MPNNSITQENDIFSSNNIADDKRPLPLIIADKWGFSLQYHIVNDNYLYAVQDWFRGLTQKENVSNYVKDFKRNNSKTGETFTPLKYTASDNKKYTRDFCDDIALYLIAQSLNARNPLGDVIAKYMAKASSKFDEYRLNPEQAITDHLPRLDNKVPEALRTPNRAHERIKGIIQRHEFTEALKNAVLNANIYLYAEGTEKLYAGLWRLTSAELRKELGVKPKESIRDYFGEMALTYTRIAEHVATEKLKDVEFVTQETAMDIVYQCAKLIYPQAQATAQILGIDLITGKKLLVSSN